MTKIFLTAIVSAPKVLKPVEWLPYLFGVNPENQPEWKSKEEFEEFFSLVVRHLNSTATLLQEEPETFEAMFHIEVIDEKEFTVPNFWCNGYLRGVDVCSEAWESLPEDLSEDFNRIYLFGTKDGLKVLDGLDDSDIKSLHDKLEAGVLKLHKYWTSQEAAL